MFRLVERGGIGVLEVPPDGRRRTGFEHGPGPPVGRGLPERVQCSLDSRGVVGEVVIDRNAMHFAAHLETSLHAGEGCETPGQVRPRYSIMSCRGDHGQGVPDIMVAELARRKPGAMLV